MLKIANSAKLFAISTVLPLTLLSGMASACAPNCVDGSNRNNLVTTWNGSDTFTIKTKNGAPLCKDVTLYGSSYVLTNPAYKGGLFGAPGSYPQSLYKTVVATLPKDKSNSNKTVVVPLSPCGNQQVDLYYGPEVTTVGAAGHGSQYINGNIITPFNSTSCTGGQGGGETTPTPPTVPATPVVPVDTPPAATSTPVVAAAEVQPTLSDTGTKTTAISLAATVLLSAAGLVFTRRSKANN